jgi:hypothetical protein
MRAMTLLALARSLIALVPFRIWRSHLGGIAASQPLADLANAQRLAAQIERAAFRLPVATKCLPRAMALSWLLRKQGTNHVLVLAVRGASARRGTSDLHAWIEVGGAILIGELPGPWLRVLELGQPMSPGNPSQQPKNSVATPQEKSD